MFYNLLFGYYDYAVTCVKSKIESLFASTPERNMVEQNVFLLLEYVLFFVGGFFTFKDEPWLYNLDLIWDSTLTLPIVVYYYLYTARYAVQLKMLNHTDKDYRMMSLHHISTLCLLMLSFWKHNKIGVTIGIVHDIADIFLLCAKISHKSYEIRKNPILDVLSNFNFIMFTLSFFITRLWFNYRVVAYYHQIDNLIVWSNPIELVLINLLHLNLMLQVIWQFMVLKFLYCLTCGLTPTDEKDESYFKQA